jgi:hypothetical protein
MASERARRTSTARSLTLRLAALSLVLAFGAQAQQMRAPPAGGSPPQGARKPMGEDGRRGPPPPPTEEIARMLALDPAKTRALDAIFKRHHERMQQLQERTREQHEQIARGTDAELAKLLDARQL